MLFLRKKWTAAAARKWLSSHGYKTPAVDKTSDYYRYRQSPPFNFKAGTFRTISFGAAKEGIKAVIAVPRGRRNPAAAPIKKSAAKRKQPWVPTLLVDLADAVSIDLEGGEVLRFRRSDNFALCSNRSGRELWIVSRRGAKNVRTSDEKGEELYEKFTGFEHDPISKMVKIHPKKMVRVGRAMDIVYRSDKFSRPGDASPYIHTFKKYPTVSVDDPKRPLIVALRGGAIRVTAEGIRG